MIAICHATYFTDIDVSGLGQIDYEIHTTATSQSILTQVNSLISEHKQTQFNGEWLLVATWDGVPPYRDYTNVCFCSFRELHDLIKVFLQINTFQGVLVTDCSRSFAVFTYFCGEMGFSNGATIGFVTGDGLFANHPASQRGSVQSIACLNEPASPWVNVVYEITAGMLLPFRWLISSWKYNT